MFDPTKEFEVVSSPGAAVNDAPAYTAGLATTFGYQDAQDNGRGAWGDRTNNAELVGVSLPRAVLKQHFGDENKAHRAMVEVINPETGARIVAPIVDKGPADWVVDRQGPTIDLTHAANQRLGGRGKTPMQWRILPDAEPMSAPVPAAGQAPAGFDPELPFEVVDEAAGFDANQPFEVVQEAMPMVQPGIPVNPSMTQLQDIAAAQREPIPELPPLEDPALSAANGQSGGQVASGQIPSGQNPSRPDLPPLPVAAAESEPGWLANAWNSFARGISSEGFYAGVGGAARAYGESVKVPEDQIFSTDEAGKLRTDWWALIATEVGNVLTDYADNVQALREHLRESLPVAPEFAESYTGGIAQGLGQMAGTLPTAVLPGALPAMAVGQIYQEGYDDALAHGETPARAHEVGLMAAPAASLDYLADRLIIGKILKPLKGKLKIGDVVKHISLASAAEGVTEGAQQVWLNTVARQLAGYDPERKLDDDVMKSIIIGGVVSGVTTGGGMAGARMVAGNREPAGISGEQSPGSSQPAAGSSASEAQAPARRKGEPATKAGTMSRTARGPTPEVTGSNPSEAPGGSVVNFDPTHPDAAYMPGKPADWEARAQRAAEELGRATEELGRSGAPPAPLKMSRTGQDAGVSIPKVLESYGQLVQTLGGRTPIRIGRFFQRALGIYKVKPSVARIRNAGDLATAAHEVAHAMQAHSFGDTGSGILTSKLPLPVTAELKRLGTALYGKRMPGNGYESEGWAEYWRIRLTEDDVARVAPKMHEWVEKVWLPAQSKATQQAVQNAKAKTDLWRSQGAYARAKAQMAKPPGRLRRLRDTVQSLFSSANWIEEFTVLRDLALEHKRLTGRDLRPSDNPYEVASRRRGSSGAVTMQMAMHGMIDMQGNLKTGADGRYIGSLQEIVRPLRGLEEEFGIYLWAKHAMEVHGRGMDPGMALQDATALVDELGAKHPDFGPASERLYAWQDSVLDYLAEANPEMHEQIERIRDSYDSYVPLQRVVDEVGSRKAASGGGSTGFFLRRKGSGRQVKLIFDQILSNTQRIVAMAHRAEVLRTVAKMSQTPGLGHLIEEVPRDRVRQSITAEMIRSQLEALGLDTSTLPGDAIIDLYSLAHDPKGGDPIIPMRFGNDIRWYHVDPEIYELLNGLEPFRLKGIWDLVLGMPARAFRLGTTGLRASFALVTNPTRDVQTYLVQTRASDNPARLLAAYVGALRELAVSGVTGKPSPYVAMFRQLAIEGGQPLGIDRQFTRTAAKQLFRGPTRNVVSTPIEFLRDRLNFLESVPRIAELKVTASRIGWTPGTPMTPDQAVALANAGKRVTVDFSAGGRIAKQVNQAVPFFNANVQGQRIFARTFRDRPVATSIKLLAYFVMPALALWWKYKDEEWYRDLPWMERFLYWNVKLDERTVIQIPKPFEWGAVAAVAEGAADSWYRQDPRGAQEALHYVGETVNPAALPVLLRAAKEQWQNRIEFFDTPIVPRGEEDVPPGEQFNEFTSELSKTLGRAFPDKVSPRRIDAAVRSVFGGVGGDVLNRSDALLRAMGLAASADRLREQESSDLFIIGRVFRRGGEVSGQNQAIADFWDDYTRYSGREDSQLMPLSWPERAYLNRLKRVRKRMKIVNDIAHATEDLDVRQSLYAEMARTARQTLEQKPTE